MRGLYEILGIERDASPEQIKRAYFKRAKETHPDKNPTDPDADERFKEVTTAFDILSDHAKRKAYDAGGDIESAAESLTRIELMLKSTVAVILRRAEPNVDLLAALRGQLIGSMEVKGQELNNARAEADKLSKFQGSYQRNKEGANVFEIAINEAISNCEVQIAACMADLEDGREMLKYLGEYSSLLARLFNGYMEGEDMAHWPEHRMKPPTFNWNSAIIE